MKRVLKIPAYRRLLAAYTLNELAFVVGTLTLALLVYRKTGSAIGAAAFFLAAQFVPALLAPPAVARLEHHRPNPVLPLLYWFEAVVFFLLAWVAGHFSLAAVLALALVDGVAALTARSLARAATVTVTAEAGLLREGNAVSNGASWVSFMVGPALGGAVVAAGGTSAALIAVGCIFGLMGLTLATATGLPEPAPSRGAPRGRVRAALVYAREHMVIRRLLLLQVFGILFFTISVPVEVVFAEHTLHAGSAGYGALLSAWGAGAVAGAAIYARWRALPSRDLIVIGAGSLGIGFLVMAIAPTLAVAIIGAGFAGMGNGVVVVAARTALQEETEERWMALMMSLNESMFQSVPGAGIVLGGTLTALGSPRSALAVAGAGSLAVTAVAWFALTGLKVISPAPGTAGAGTSAGAGAGAGTSAGAGASEASAAGAPPSRDDAGRPPWDHPGRPPSDHPGRPPDHPGRRPDYPHPESVMNSEPGAVSPGGPAPASAAPHQ